MTPDRTAQESAISVRDLSKKYRRFASTADTLKELLHPFGKKYHDEFWALKGVSFEVKKGETIGLIGRNGSGKSTLLQVLCGILQPTTGSVEVSGRVAALLELGAGFSPDFSGRENVYMNGALMGLTRQEMDERFSLIAEFAEIGDFMEQPVKTYSSGMYVRLAFAVAINVDPDILIVDEALSVGDEAFQRKCYGRINAIRDKGSTVIFVSHSASTIVELCSKAMLFDHGELLLIGSPKAVVSRYHKLIYAPAEKIEPMREEIRAFNRKVASLPEGETREEGPPEPAGQDDTARRSYYDPHLVPKSTVWYEPRGAQIENPRITTLNGKRVNILIRGGEYIYTYDVKFIEPAYNVRFGMLIKSTTGISLGGISSHRIGEVIDSVEKDSLLRVVFKFRCVFLPGVFFFNSGALGAVEGAETFLHRGVDVAMFRVHSEAGSQLTELIDISSSLSGPVFEMVYVQNT